MALVSKLSGKPIESAADSPSSQPSSPAPPAATPEAPPVRSAPAPSTPPTPTPTATGSQARGQLATSENLKLTVDESGLATLTFNRPRKKNALTLEARYLVTSTVNCCAHSHSMLTPLHRTISSVLQMYEEWGKLSRQIALDERIRVLAITGAHALRVRLRSLRSLLFSSFATLRLHTYSMTQLIDRREYVYMIS